MNTLLFSVISGCVVAVLCALFKGKDNKEQTSRYGFKVFIITSIAVFLLHTYLQSTDSSLVCQEIETGEPPF
jgi:hypothetical protein